MPCLRHGIAIHCTALNRFHASPLTSLHNTNSLVSLFSEFVGFASMSILTAVVFYFLVEGPFGQVERLIFKVPKAVAVNHDHETGEGEGEGEAARKRGQGEVVKEKEGRGREEGVVVAVAVPDVASEDSMIMMTAVQQ